MYELLKLSSLLPYVVPCGSLTLLTEEFIFIAVVKMVLLLPLRVGNDRLLFVQAWLKVIELYVHFGQLRALASLAEDGAGAEIFRCIIRLNRWLQLISQVLVDSKYRLALPIILVQTVN